MKKLIVAVIAVCVLEGAAFEQEVPGTLASPFMADSIMLKTNSYVPMFIDKVTSRVSSKYLLEIEDADLDEIAVLGGKNNIIDTPFEIAALSLASGVIDIRPVEADAILPRSNLKLSYTKLAASAYQDALLARFLGNTAAVGIHEGELKFALDKGGITRAEVESFYRQNIGAYVAEIVNGYAQENKFSNASALTEIKKAMTDFLRGPSPATYSALLLVYRSNAGIGAIVLGRSVGSISPEVHSALVDNKTPAAE